MPTPSPWNYLSRWAFPGFAQLRPAAKQHQGWLASGGLSRPDRHRQPGGNHWIDHARGSDFDLLRPEVQLIGWFCQPASPDGLSGAHADRGFDAGQTSTRCQISRWDGAIWTPVGAGRGPGVSPGGTRWHRILPSGHPEQCRRGPWFGQQHRPDGSSGRGERHRTGNASAGQRLPTGGDSPESPPQPGHGHRG